MKHHPESQTDGRHGQGIWRIGKLTLAILLLFVSMMSFPSVLPWMILVWLIVAAFRLLRGQSTALVLATVSVIVVIKNPEWSWSLIGLIIVMVAIAIWQCWRVRVASALSICLLAPAWIVFLGDHYFAANTSRQSRSDSRAIVCLGDSLTDSGYPAELQRLVKPPIADFGFDGINSSEALEKLPEILDTNPQAVVIELGGHDFNQRRPRSVTLANLRNIIEALQSRSIEVIIVEIPRGFVRDGYRGIERQLAREYDLQLVSDSIIRKFVLFSPIIPPGMWMSHESHLSDDGLHPNALGNQAMALVIADALSQVFGNSIPLDQ